MCQGGVQELEPAAWKEGVGGGAGAQQGAPHIFHVSGRILSVEDRLPLLSVL